MGKYYNILYYNTYDSHPWQWYMSANLYDIYYCRAYSEKLLMTDRGSVGNMYGMVSIIIYYIML